MVNVFLFIAMLVFVCVYWRWADIQRVYWSNKYKSEQLSKQDQEVLIRYMPIYKNMTDEDRAALEKQIIWFLGEKRILGRDGLQVTRAMKLLIAADACLLVLNALPPLYPNVKEVLLYPSSYYVPQSSKDAAGLVNYHTSVRQGESWPGGTLVLSWDNVLEGHRLPEDGHNLVFHEFAHQLDQQTGSTNGTPLLASEQLYKDWARVFTKAYSTLKTHVAYQMPHVIHSYGATNEAEFFAVLTETFLEKPFALQQYDPELFSLLEGYFGFDPRRWYRR